MKIIFTNDNYKCPFCGQYVGIHQDGGLLMECLKLRSGNSWHRVKGSSKSGKAQGTVKILPDKPIVRLYENNTST